MLREYDPLLDRYIMKVPPYQARWLDKDIFGQDNVLHVKWKWNALQAAEFFGEDNLPMCVKIQLQNGRHYDETEYIQAIYGAGDPIYSDLPEDVALTRPWMEHFVCTSATQNEQKILEPKNKGPGYFQRPFSSWHYHRNWHEVYSRTMAHFAIYDTRGANAHFEAVFGEAEVSLRPPTWAMRTMQSILDLTPGGENYARNTKEYEMPPQFLQRASGYDVGVDFGDRLIGNINRWFHVDLFMQISQMILTKNQPETAYGLMRAEAEKQGQLAPQVETYETQVLGDTHTGLLDAEMDREPAYPWGALPEPPDIVKEFSEGGLDVEFVGPLSMAQIRDRTVLNFYRNLGVAEAVAGFSPEAMHKIKWPEALERVMEAGNFPQGDLRSADEYAELVEGIRQRAIQAEVAQNAPKMAQAIKNLQGTTEQGSPLKALTGDAA
ncbi:MAG: hypothetical protein AMJ65_07215 [Phycisphaerae bacterium SG8_4]|nr:MAG: hypothetical protein AMJ65_07215 [Phycisphaerae bacterium SG8_4]